MSWIDIVFLIFIIYFIITNKGFIDTFFEVISLLAALIISFKTYSFFGKLLINLFDLPRGIAHASGFFIAWFVIEFIFYLVYNLFLFQKLMFLRKNTINLYLGFIAAIIQGFIIYLFIISLIFSLPVKPELKKDILESRTGHYLVTLSSQLDQQINQVFNEAILETVNFLTIKPNSEEVVDLHFTLNDNQMSQDSQSEIIMLNLVNQERTKQGLNTLTEDDKLRNAARSYAKEMFRFGFFSHISKVDNSSPGDRASRDNITYTFLGENLAYAPDVYIAHQGLMNSPGHRANILSTDFNRVGIGIIDGGIYGRIFVQEFSN